MNDLLPAVLADAERERDVEAADAAAAGPARAPSPRARRGPRPAERFLEEASRASRAIDALRGGLARLRGLHAGCARRARRSLPRALRPEGGPDPGGGAAKPPPSRVERVRLLPYRPFKKPH